MMKSQLAKQRRRNNGRALWLVLVTLLLVGAAVAGYYLLTPATVPSQAPEVDAPVAGPAWFEEGAREALCSQVRQGLAPGQ